MNFQEQPKVAVIPFNRNASPFFIGNTLVIIDFTTKHHDSIKRVQLPISLPQ